MISVVIPARDSQETIRVTVETLFYQTMRPDEVVIVVCPGDTTHTEIEDYIALGFVRMIVKDAPKEYVREAHWKRWMGIKEAKGDVIFLTDSKGIVEEHAIENAYNMMVENNVSVVAGMTPAWPDQRNNFWAELHDKALVSNLPEFPEKGILTHENFGKTESLPVTSALMLRREVFDAVQADFGLEFSKLASTYDDYVLSWLIVKAGFQILVTNRVIAHHKHRASWQGYSTQISRSGQSAAIMAKMYNACPFGTRRVVQVSITMAALCTVTTFSASIPFIFGIQGIQWALLAAIMGYMGLGALNMIKARQLKAFAFPLFTILLILTFSLHFTKAYVKSNNNPHEVAAYLQIH